MTLTILNSLPQEGDSIVGMRPFQLRYLNGQLVGLIKYKETADTIMSEQKKIIDDYVLINEKKDQQIANLETTNKNTRRTWRKRLLGTGIGGLSLGLTIGLLLPIIID